MNSTIAHRPSPVLRIARQRTTGLAAAAPAAPVADRVADEASVARGFGILTLATTKDYVKAIGLALSVRLSNPGLPIAVACPPSARSLLEPYFDYVVDEQPGLRGFVHKVHLDRYSPFEKTLFFDSDVLVFRPVLEVIQQWLPQPYAACGRYRNDGVSAFGMVRAEVLQRIGKTDLVVIDGAGHAFFRKPDCIPIFEKAREVTARHREIIGPIPYADEDVMDVVMTLLDVPPMPFADFFSRHLSARPGTLRLDTRRNLCEFVEAEDGLPRRPCMMHFAADEAPFTYHRELLRLFRMHDLPTRDVYRSFLHDVHSSRIRPSLARLRKRIGPRK